MGEKMKGGGGVKSRGTRSCSIIYHNEILRPELEKKRTYCSKNFTDNNNLKINIWFMEMNRNILYLIKLIRIPKTILSTF